MSSPCCSFACSEVLFSSVKKMRPKACRPDAFADSLLTLLVHDQITMVHDRITLRTFEVRHETWSKTSVV